MNLAVATFRKSNLQVIIACSVSLFLTQVLNSQSRAADSLLRVANSSSHDTLKAKALNELSKIYLSGGDFSRALEKSDQAKVLAAQLASSSNKEISLSGKRSGAKAYNNCGIIFYSQGKFAEAILNYQRAMKMREELGDKKGVAAATGNIGLTYFHQGNYGEALNYHFAALRLREEIQDTIGIGNSLDNIGITYFRQGKNPEALKYLLAAVKKRELAADKKGLSDSYNNLGSFYETALNFEKAMEYLQRTLDIAGELGDQVRMSHVMANMANVLTRQNKYDEAIEKYKACLELMREQFDSVSYASTLSNIGIVYAMQGNYKEAIRKQTEALEIKKKRNERHGIALCLVRIAEAYFKLQEIPNAELFCNKAFEEADKVQDLEQLSELNALASEIYMAGGDYRKAFSYFKAHIRLRDSVVSQENTKKIVQQQMQYDFDKKSAADSIRNAEAKKLEDLRHSQEIARQKTFTFAGVGGFLVMITVAFISFRAFRNKKRANEEISRQKNLVEEKQKEILDSIYYARRIQRALITSEFYISRSLKKFKTPHEN
jgi:tetratricopeptide (TPR) repeat protein